jgi:diaminohydroxyphosphoribosylaminopyrimidine deaminase/5-amino-6-(5-phosphoribosylamino)uracil reductase
MELWPSSVYASGSLRSLRAAVIEILLSVGLLRGVVWLQGLAVTDPQAKTLEKSSVQPLLDELREEALCHRFEVAPNPCVGAAILAGGRVIGRGYHEFWGGPHAEVNAIEAARASGVKESEWELLVVTLEPCSSEGKTPPCVEAVLALGIKQVVIGCLDPDPRHRGAAIKLLEDAGVEVLHIDESAKFEEDNDAFCAWMSPKRERSPRPWVIAKWAQTRTGQLTPPEDVGEGRWISAENSQLEVQTLRGRVDVIVTGAGTVKADDPRLTLRGASLGAAPKRVVLDSYLRTSPSARILQEVEDGEVGGEVIIFTLAGADGARWRALVSAGAKVVGLHGDESGRVSLSDAYQWLWEEGMRRVLLEGGPELLSSHLGEALIDQVRVYTGDVFGGRGVSLGQSLAGLEFTARLDRECAPDSVLEAFLLEEE